jgi:hypothetical protein
VARKKHKYLWTCLPPDDGSCRFLQTLAGGAVKPYLGRIRVDEGLALVEGLAIVIIYDVKVSSWKSCGVGGVSVVDRDIAEAAVL